MANRSPFPGMDPYLESHWQAVHAILIAETWRSLNRILPPDLSATVEERVAIESDDGTQKDYRVGPDVYVVAPEVPSWERASAEVMVIDAPFRLVVDLESATERSVRIVNHEGQLITVIEYISPANKRNPGLEAYQKKRTELHDAGVHVVEIDLVREGNWRNLLAPHTCPTPGISLYRVAVRPAGTPTVVYLYPIRLQDTLPEIPIPLRPHDPKLMLPLQPMIETIYSDGRYGRTLNYSQPLDLPLTAGDEQFARSKISAGG